MLALTLNNKAACVVRSIKYKNKLQYDILRESGRATLKTAVITGSVSPPHGVPSVATASFSRKTGDVEYPFPVCECGSSSATTPSGGVSVAPPAFSRCRRSCSCWLLVCPRLAMLASCSMLQVCLKPRGIDSEFLALLLHVENCEAFSVDSCFC